MNCMYEPKSRLGYLSEKFDKSGFEENPIISDDELDELLKCLKEVKDYMEDRMESSVAFCITMEIETIENILWRRKNMP